MLGLPSLRTFSALLLGPSLAALAIAGLAGAVPQAGAQHLQEQPLGAAAPTAPAYLKKAGVSQNLNQELPLNDTFRDSDGAQVTLGRYFQERPVVLAFVYYKCRLLCPQVLHGMATALRQVSFTPGKQYDILVTSIDPTDTPADSAAEKQRFLGWLGDPGAASSVHFLTGPQSSITDFTQAAGFHYVLVPGPDGKLDQFAHSAVIMFATPDGRMSKYLSGVQYEPRDLRLALVQASKRHIGSITDLVLLYCCSYSPAVGKYTVSILRVLSLAAAATLLLIAAGIYLLRSKSKNLPHAV